MPILRKVSPAEAATWPLDSRLVDAQSLLAAVAGDDRVGLTRMDYPKKRMHGWMARVYSGGRTITRFWADEAHGGAEVALRTAVAWRDTMRQSATPSRRARGTAWRVVRVDRPEHKNVGYFAYADRRRYFSDTAHAGPEQARAAAEAWLADRRAALEDSRAEPHD